MKASSPDTWHPLARPASEIRDEDVRIEAEMELRLIEDHPSTGPTDALVERRAETTPEA